MDRRRAAGTLLALAACLATSYAAPTATSNHTALDLYDEVSEGCYYNFQHYGEGDRIMTNEPCLNCTCHNRMLMCYLKVCPFTKAIGQDCTVEKRADQCCPIVTCPDVPVDLLTSTSTSSPAEYGGTGIGKINKYGCSINGKYFPEGAKVPPTPNKPCEHCYCIRNMTTCVMQECTLHVDGCTPIYHKDVCCPVRYFCDHPEDEMPLLDDMTTTVRPTPGFLLTTIAPTETTEEPETTTLPAKRDCIENDQLYPDGALIKTDKPCQHCYCMKGDIVCVVQECGTPMENEGKNCTSIAPREGQCCPDTYICEGDELSSEPTTALPFEDLATTTVLPPRRVSVEGSGYRNEDEVLYTEAPTFATELEGSGEEDLTERPEITTAKGELVDKFGPTDESEFIPKTTSPTFIDEIKKATTEPDKGLNTVPSDDEESTKPSLLEQSTSRSEVSATEPNRRFEYETTLGDVTEKKEQSARPEIPEETVTFSYEKKETEPTIFEESTTPGSGDAKPSFTETLPQEEQKVTGYLPSSGEESKEPEDQPQTTPSIFETPLATEIPQTTENLIDTEREGLAEEKATTESTIISTIPSEEIDKLSHTTDTRNTPVVDYFTESPSTDLTTGHENLDDHAISEQNTVPVSADEEQSTKPTLLEETAAKDEIHSTESPSFTEQHTERPEEHSEPTILQKSTTRADFETTEAPITVEEYTFRPTTVKEEGPLSTPEYVTTSAAEEEHTIRPTTVKEEGPLTTAESVTTSAVEEEHTIRPTTVKEEGPLTTPESVTTSAAEEVTKEPIIVSPTAKIDEQQITTALPSQGPEIEKTTVEPIMELSTFAHISDKESVTPTIFESETATAITEKIESMEGITVSEAENEIRPPGRIPGEGDCLLEGITYKNDSIVPNTNKCHTGCKCFSSIIKCDPIICSSAPEDMANCQPRYDTPESCCPTYICDHGMETIPPQAQSHITGTESPTSSPATECTGDQCQVSEDKQEPTVPFRRDECDGEGCKLHIQVPLEGCTGSTCELPQPTPEKDFHPTTEDCTGNACELPHATPEKEFQQPPSQNIPQEVPVQVPQYCINPEDCKEMSVPPSCEGSSCPGEVQGPVCDQEKGCDVEPEIPPPKIVPELCGSDGECKPVNLPVPEKPLCEGESCSTQPSQVAEPTKCVGDKCVDEGLGNKFGCSDDECLQQTVMPTKETAFTGTATTAAADIETTSSSGTTSVPAELDNKEQESSIPEDTSEPPQHSTSVTKESEIPPTEASEKTTEEAPKLTEGPDISDFDTTGSPFRESESSQGTTLPGIIEKTEEVTKTPEKDESDEEGTTAQPEEESEKPEPSAITGAVTAEAMTTAKFASEEGITETPAVSESQDLKPADHDKDVDQSTKSSLDIETKSPDTEASEKPSETETAEDFETKHTTEEEIQPQTTAGYEALEDKITTMPSEVTKESEGAMSTLIPELASSKPDSTVSEEELNLEDNITHGLEQSSEPAVPVSSKTEPTLSVTEKAFTEGESEGESHSTEKQHLQPEHPETTAPEPYEEEQYERTTSLPGVEPETALTETSATKGAESSSENIIEISSTTTEPTELETKQPETIHTEAPIIPEDTEKRLTTKEPIFEDVITPEQEVTKAPELSTEKDIFKSTISQETPYQEDFTREGELSTQEPQKLSTEPSISEEFVTKQPQVEPTEEKQTEQPEKPEISTEQTEKGIVTQPEKPEELATTVVQYTTEAVPESSVSEQEDLLDKEQIPTESAPTIKPEDEKEEPVKTTPESEQEQTQTSRPEDEREESATTVRLEDEQQESAQLTTPQSKFEEPAPTSRPESEIEEEYTETPRPQGEQESEVTEADKEKPEKPSPSIKPEVEKEEPSSTLQPEVEHEELTSKPEGVTENYTPTSRPEGESEEVISTSKPEVELEETTSTSKSEREPAPTSQPKDVTEDYSPTSNPEVEQEETTLASKPEKEQEEPAPTSRPEGELEGAVATSRPETEQEELASTLEPGVEQGESTQTSKPESAETSRPEGESEISAPTSIPKVEQEEPVSTIKPEKEPEKPAQTSEPEVEPEESMSTAKPETEQQEATATSIPESEPEEPVVTSRPEGELEETTPTHKPEIELQKPAKPDAEQGETAETSRPDDKLEEPSSTSRPERLPEEFAPTSLPGTEQGEPAETSRPEGVAPTSKPEVEQEEPATTSKAESETEKLPEGEQEDYITTSKPEDELQKLATTSKPEAEQEEPALTSRPQSELEEPAPTSIATDKQEEPAQTYLPELHTSSTESIRPELTPEDKTPTSTPETEQSETTPYVVELELHTHKMDEEPISQPSEEPATSITEQESTERLPSEQLKPELSEKETERPHEEAEGTERPLGTEEPQVTTVSHEKTENISEPGLVDKFGTTPKQPTAEEELTTSGPPAQNEKVDTENLIPTQETEQEATAKPLYVPIETTAPEEEFIPVTPKVSTPKSEQGTTTRIPPTKPEEKPAEIPSTSAPEIPKPDELPQVDEDFPPTGGYNQEPESDYGEEDQAFGPGTCRYGGKVYVSAQQIPRDDPCDFCFCFRSDIICLQQSCPPPIHGCHEEPIQGFCCPRYECPVSMATSLNVTTTTTTTTTTLPPHFLPHAYKGAAQRKGCQIKGHTYQVGEVVRASSGPCLHCTCGGDGQMKCDPKACTPEPMLRQMIAAAVSAKRRR